MEPVIRFRAAVALAGRFPVLAGLDLDVADGERLWISGANGAGKTSLLRACAGLLPIRSGVAEVLGCDVVADRRAVRPLVGYAAHAAGLYEDLSPLENVRFWADANRVARADAPAALDRVGLASRLRDVPTAQLSAGQRRRVSLASMIVRRPRLWLLDEPHAGLDADGRDVVDALIGDAAAAGATVLFASHEPDRAAGVATRHVTLAGGAVAADGPADAPEHAPGDPHVE